MPVTRIEGGVRQFVVEGDATVYGRSGSGEVFRLEGSGDQQRLEVLPRHPKGTPVKIAFDGRVYALMPEGDLYRLERGDTWWRLPCDVGGMCSFDARGDVFAVCNADGRVVRFTGTEFEDQSAGDAPAVELTSASGSARYPSSWYCTIATDGQVYRHAGDRITALGPDGVRVRSVAIGGTDLVCVTDEGRLMLHRRGREWRTKAAPPNLRWVGASNNGVHLLVVDRDGRLFQLGRDGEWELRAMAPSLLSRMPVRVSCLRGVPWYITEDGGFARLEDEGVVPIHTHGEELVDVAIGTVRSKTRDDDENDDGLRIFVVSRDGRVLRHTGGPWQPVPYTGPPMRRVAIGGGELWGLNADGVAIRHVGGGRWVQTSSPAELIDIDVGDDGNSPHALYGVSDSGQPYRYNGKRWKPILFPRGTLVGIAVGGGNVWGIGSNRLLYRLGDGGSWDTLPTASGGTVDFTADDDGFEFSVTGLGDIVRYGNGGRTRQRLAVCAEPALPEPLIARAAKDAHVEVWPFQEGYVFALNHKATQVVGNIVTGSNTNKLFAVAALRKLLRKGITHTLSPGGPVVAAATAPIALAILGYLVLDGTTLIGQDNGDGTQVLMPYPGVFIPVPAGTVDRGAASAREYEGDPNKHGFWARFADSLGRDLRSGRLKK